MDDIALRLGYNYAKSPIETYGPLGTAHTGPGTNGVYEAAAVNTFNLIGFPAITENHVTLGAGIAFSKTVSLDVAYVYGWTSGQTGDVITNPAGGPNSVGSATVDNDQNSISAMVKFNF